VIPTKAGASSSRILVRTGEAVADWPTTRGLTMRKRNKARPLAIALAISLSTPAAAVTISLTSTFSTFQVRGPENLGSFALGLPTDRGTLVPAPVLYASWEYFVDVTPLMFSSGPGGIVASNCYPNPFVQCFPEGQGVSLDLHAGDVIRFGYFWTGFTATGVIPRPEIQLTFNTPEGVTLSQTPLPAAWLVFASALAGVGGWLGLRKARPGMKLDETRGSGLSP
jgi:hypothetical protein